MEALLSTIRTNLEKSKFSQWWELKNVKQKLEIDINSELAILDQLTSLNELSKELSESSKIKFTEAINNIINVVFTKEENKLIGTTNNKTNTNECDESDFDCTMWT